jgi:hypothetical protein
MDPRREAISMNRSLKNMEKKWRQEAEEGKEYLEAQIEQSDCIQEVNVGDLDYNFSAFKDLFLEDAYRKAETEGKFYYRLGSVMENFDLSIAQVKFDGWIGDYFGEMEAQLSIRGSGQEDTEIYWHLDRGVADLTELEDENLTAEAVGEIEDTLEALQTEIDRNTESRTDYGWDVVNQAVAQD